MTTWLSEHLSLEELTITTHRGIDNTPPPAIVEELRRTAAHMERVRTVLGAPILVSSGYRCQLLNREIGGAISSAHLGGFAVDFIAPRFGTPLAICKRLVALREPGGLIDFDQIIEEGTWVHLSFDPRMRGGVLTKSPKGGYAPGLRS